RSWPPRAAARRTVGNSGPFHLTNCLTCKITSGDWLHARRSTIQTTAGAVATRPHFALTGADRQIEAGQKPGFS
ncbi:MAG TPA: hypothetical protein PK170_07670, partial [Anaerolineae bacterium]|nr:hypothetical protein [Anaerolineae bacterium]